MTDLMVLVFILIFMAVIYGHSVESYKSRIEAQEEEIKWLQEYILKLMEEGVKE